MAKLQCKLCDYKSGNLVPHIEQAHSDEITLEQYLEEYGGIDSVIHSSLRKKVKKGTTDMIEICGVEMPKKKPVESIKEHVPKSNAAYQFQDVAFDVCSDILDNQCVMLIGHTGTGKTSLVSEIAARINQPLMRINMNNQTTISDFCGYMGASDGSTYWVDGALPWAMKHGAWLLIDEIDFAEPEILALLNAVLEKDGFLTLKECGSQVIHRHKDFRIFATANAVGQLAAFRSLYQGTNIMNEAFLDRWHCYVIDYMPAELEAQMLVDTCEQEGIKMTLSMSKLLVRVANECRKAFTNEEIESTFSTRRLIDWAKMCYRHRKKKAETPFLAAESVIFSKTSREDREVIKNLMDRILRGNA
jgi:cobaltochelatase CobS